MSKKTQGKQGGRKRKRLRASESPSIEPHWCASRVRGTKTLHHLEAEILGKMKFQQSLINMFGTGARVETGKH